MGPCNAMNFGKWLLIAAIFAESMTTMTEVEP
jgi:hypothetical protein